MARPKKYSEPESKLNLEERVELLEEVVKGILKWEVVEHPEAKTWFINKKV